ncbi:N-acetylglucosaminyl deacetylase, LmbE family [Cryobacterium psychrotolerans]|uniref:N-acetylglucosaminyl deacetylase, LmbE family n=1 Tax=Cryobacterium psychrotolerans TaxID=386301 RepID=A0A1G8XRU0_9MICO|nr:hypothetical protein [Cryobacterium psychrotolerans]TFD82833.1 hypothetical protein E3T56_13830 [Cryobacterium psychrotolerans]SDJ92605.1 N-acetylglucosaminyl deacetylase, LmbE family [Cryobacterium psychrotolerans]
MVMSGSEERVVFVHDRPGDEALATGGTIARLRSDGAPVVVLFGAMLPGESDAARAGLAELGVTEWQTLPAASAGREDALRRALAEARATAVAIGSTDEGLRESATRAAEAMGVPVFLARRVTQGAGARLVAIDVSDMLERKRGALAAYPDRWTVTDGAAELPDGSLLAVTGTEAFLRNEPDAREVRGIPPSRGARLAAAAIALLLGAAFALLGTIAHQGVFVLGPVTIPIGLILALLAVSALLVGLRLVFGDRMVVFSCAIGMLGTIFLLSLRSTGGSVLVPAGLPGTLWSIVPALVATFVLAWPHLPAKR